MPVSSEFYAKRSTRVGYVVLAVVCGALELGSVAMRGMRGGGFSIWTVFFAWMAVRNSKLPVVRLFEDHAEFFSPVLARRESIPFAGVIQFYEPFKGAAVIVANVVDESRRFELPLDRLSSSDGELLVARLRELRGHREPSSVVRASNSETTRTTAILAPVSRAGD